MPQFAVVQLLSGFLGLPPEQKKCEAQSLTVTLLSLGLNFRMALAFSLTDQRAGDLSLHLVLHLPRGHRRGRKQCLLPFQGSGCHSNSEGSSGHQDQALCTLSSQDRESFLGPMSTDPLEPEGGDAETQEARPYNLCGPWAHSAQTGITCP